MDRTYTLEYTPQLVRRSVRRFWRRAVGWKFIAAILAVLWFLLSAIRGGDRSWYVGFLGTVGAFGVLFSIALYVVHYRRAMTAYRRLKDGRALLRVGDRTFTFESAIGFSELSWNSISEVWRYDDAWLLVFSKAMFGTVPLASLDAEGRDIIENQVRLAGAVVR